MPRKFFKTDCSKSAFIHLFHQYVWDLTMAIADHEFGFSFNKKRDSEQTTITCENIKRGEPIEIAITKATLMHISEDNYASDIIRRKAASWMRMTEETKVRWTANEQRMRNYFRRCRRNTNPTSQNANETIEID